MKQRLRLLVLEDSTADYELLLRELRRSYDLVHARVETAEAMIEALDREQWDVIISDYSMPAFSAPRAISILRERGSEIPLLIVSGTVGEEVAVEAMLAGARDFMGKGNLARLRPALERELREVAAHAERKKVEQQLLVSERMASVGVVAAGVAHEINNPLAAVLANLRLVHEKMSELSLRVSTRDGSYPGSAAGNATQDDDFRARVTELLEPLGDSLEAAESMRAIVQDLKIFSRGEDETVIHPVDVHRVLESAIRMATNEIRHRASLVTDYGDIPPVNANEGRLGQVFLNLIMNAAQAIPEGNAANNEIRIVTRAGADTRVVIEVHDTGSGIAPEVIHRVFSSFFTTKEPGSGTGLGLSISQRIVQSLEGEISVESALGAGSVFRVTLPAAILVADPVPDSARATLDYAANAKGAGMPVGRRARILVVDDESLIARALTRLLSQHFEVESLTSAREALDLLRDQRYDAILCDLMMPEVTGMDLYAALAQSAPDQARRMIFMTGGVFSSNAQHFLDTVSNPRVDKPFDVNQVLATLDAVVTGRFPA